MSQFEAFVAPQAKTRQHITKGTTMKRTIALAVLFSISSASSALAGKTSIYEAEEVKVQTFSAKVKSVRDAGDDGVDITFESDVATGYYSLSPKKIKNYNEIHQYVEKSRKSNGPILKVSAEKDEKIIRSVSIVEKAEKAAGPVDLNKSVDSTIDALLKGQKGN